MTTVEVRLKTWTVDEYHRMIEVGLLGPDDRVELLAGEIVDKMPIGSRHAACVDRSGDLLAERAGDGYRVRRQNPVTLDDASEPEPDLALVAWRDDYFAGGHPRPTDVALLVEVADSSLALDRRRKLPLYGAAGVPESWLIDLIDEVVEVHSGPGLHGYGTIQIHRRDEDARSATVPDFTLAVEDLLGPPSPE